MTYLAPIPRVRPSGWLVRLSGVANANRPPVPVETRAPRQLTDDERAALPHFANLRDGSMAEPPRVGIHPMTLLAAALVGACMWVVGFWIVRAVWTALMAIRFPDVGGF